MMLTDFKNTWLSNHIDDLLGSYPDKGAVLDVGSLSVPEGEVMDTETLLKGNNGVYEVSAVLDVGWIPVDDLQVDVDIEISLKRKGARCDCSRYSSFPTFCFVLMDYLGGTGDGVQFHWSHLVIHSLE